VLRRLTPWLALLGLVGATILLWQARFAAIPHPFNGDAGFEAGFDGWSTGGGKNGLRQENGSTVARFARPARDGEYSSASRWFGPLEGLRYLHVEMEAKWQDVIIKHANWLGPRLVLMSKDPRESNRHNWDHWAYIASGSRDWHREEVVFELDPGMSDVGLAFQMLARQGEMEVREFRITAVRLRPWIPAATALLVIGWAICLASRLRGRKQPVSWWRAGAAAILIVASSWYLVFPGPGTQYRPLVGSLLIGSTESPSTPTADPAQQPAAPETSAGRPSQAVPAPAAPASETAQPAKPRMRVIPAINHTQQPTPAAPPKSSTAPSPPPTVTRPAPSPHPKPPSQPITSDDLRNLDLKLDLLHILPFLGLSLGVFLILGTLRPWPLLSAVALLSEIMPNWHGRWTGADDLLDLAANVVGVALGAGAYVLIRRLVKKLPRRRQPARPANA